MNAHKLEISSFDALSRAHPRRDRSWGKVRQSEANLVTGIRSTPDGDCSRVPTFPEYAEESTLLHLQPGQIARRQLPTRYHLH